MTIFYYLFDKLYVNLTNRCSCECVFCIRKNSDAVGSADSLWLEHEPDMNEIKSAFDEVDLTGITEIVFCGYGEPTERVETVIETAEYIKTKTDIPLRLNTNGLTELINPEFDISELEIFDSISISLNADNREDYFRLTRPKFGEKSFDAMLDFARKIKAFCNTNFTVVNLPELNIEKCRIISEEIGIELRIRHCVTNNENYN
ncbi:MAG: TatD family nuclease-associated radical SAM protein [Oscillospiraceae bacterium]|nr:TatD family nuclease-associated radical SAM protein [Oscillospiraceae bacterium]